MIRFLQVNEGKNCPIRKASADMTRGAAITVNYGANTVAPATNTTGGIYLVDVAPQYTGINAIIAPNDAGFETIKTNDLVIEIPTYFGERYATTELTIGSLVVGDYLAATAGKFVKGATGNVCEWVYCGTYADPTGLQMYAIEKVAPKTV